MVNENITKLTDFLSFPYKVLPASPACRLCFQWVNFYSKKMEGKLKTLENLTKYSQLSRFLAILKFLCLL